MLHNSQGLNHQRPTRILSSSRPWTGVVSLAMHSPHIIHFWGYNERHFQGMTWIWFWTHFLSSLTHRCRNVCVWMYACINPTVSRSGGCLCICPHWVLFYVALITHPIVFRVGSTTYDHSVDCWWTQSEAFSGLRTPTQCRTHYFRDCDRIMGVWCLALPGGHPSMNPTALNIA